MIGQRASVQCAFLTFLITSTLAVAQQPTYVQITGDQFTYNGQVRKIKGTNYYPQNHMWADMWSEWDWSEIVQEVQMVRGLGLNSVRILVPYSNGGWNGPNVPTSRLNMLQDVVDEFGENGIRSCVTLFDWETSFAAAGTATETNHITYLNAIVQRLKNNPYVLCWDVKNEPDHPSNIGGFDNWDSSPTNRDKIVSWLGRMEAAVKARDPNHPVSAGIRWWQNVQDVISFEDIAMFHSYWGNIDTQQIPDVKSYMVAGQKPILVEEYGWPTNPSPNYTEALQLSFFTTHLNAFTHHNIAGGIQWMTFDSTNYSGSQSESYENHFGLWRFGYALKPGGAYYRDNFPVTQFPVEPDSIPPGPVTNLSAQPHTYNVSLSWSTPSDRDYSGALVLCKTTGYPSGPTDGQLLADVPGVRSASGACSHTGFLYGTRYFYAVFAHDDSGNYAPAAVTSAMTLTPGDFDHDYDIDMADFAHLQGCLSGPHIVQSDPACWDAMLDEDTDVDSDDLQLLLQCMSGPDVPVAPDCGS